MQNLIPSLAAACLLSLAFACSKQQQDEGSSPTPDRIELSVPGIECVPGDSVPVQATVLDTNGRQLDSPVSWASDSSAAEASQAGVTCKSIGKATLVATAGSASGNLEVVVKNPLLGRWERQDDEKAGMVIEIHELGSAIVGDIVQAPTEAAVPVLVRTQRLSEAAAKRLVQCFAEPWAPGLRKWRSIEPAGDGRWSVEDLHKDVKFARNGNCFEAKTKAEYKGGFEIQLVGKDQIVLRNLAVKGEQRWERAGTDESATEPAQGTAPAPLPGPSDSEWSAVKEATVRGSSALKCETKVLDGYFRAVCGENDGGKPKTVSFIGKSSPGAIARVEDGKLVLIHPYTSGTEFKALFEWTGKTSRLHVSWPKGAPQPPMVGTFDGPPPGL